MKLVSKVALKKWIKSFRLEYSYVRFLRRRGSYELWSMHCKMFGLYSYHTSAVVLSRKAMLTVSPNKQYCGVFLPTNPAATGPECMPGRRKI